MSYELCGKHNDSQDQLSCVRKSGHEGQCNDHRADIEIQKAYNKCCTHCDSREEVKTFIFAAHTNMSTAIHLCAVCMGIVCRR